MKEAPRRPNISEVHLKAAREAAGIKQKETLSILRQVEPRVDKPMVSKYENGVCIPTPSQLSALMRPVWLPALRTVRGWDSRILPHGRPDGEKGRNQSRAPRYI